MAEVNPRVKFDLQLLALFITIVAGLVAVTQYVESKKSKAMAEENARLENEIKKLQLEKLKATKKG